MPLKKDWTDNLLDLSTKWPWPCLEQWYKRGVLTVNVNHFPRFSWLECHMQCNRTKYRIPPKSYGAKSATNNESSTRNRSPETDRFMCWFLMVCVLHKESRHRVQSWWLAIITDMTNWDCSWEYQKVERTGFHHTWGRDVKKQKMAAEVFAWVYFMYVACTHF